MLVLFSFSLDCSVMILIAQSLFRPLLHPRDPNCDLISLSRLSSSPHLPSPLHRLPPPPPLPPSSLLPSSSPPPPPPYSTQPNQTPNPIKTDSGLKRFVKDRQADHPWGQQDEAAFIKVLEGELDKVVRFQEGKVWGFFFPSF